MLTACLDVNASPMNAVTVFNIAIVVSVCAILFAIIIANINKDHEACKPQDWDDDCDYELDEDLNSLRMSIRECKDIPAYNSETVKRLAEATQKMRNEKKENESN